MCLDTLLTSEVYEAITKIMLLRVTFVDRAHGIYVMVTYRVGVGAHLRVSA